MRKNLLSALLASCMALALLPGTALAEQSGQRYYRSTLSDREGKIYDAFAGHLTAIQSGKAVKVEQAAILDVRKAVYAFQRDYPEFFWLGAGYDICYGSSGAEVSLSHSASWANGSRTIDADQTAADTAVAAIVKEAEKETSTAGQLRYVHDWLTKNNRYNTSVLKSDAETDSTPWSAVSALDAKLSPVCEGYSRAFKLICDQLEIPCILVSGTGTNNRKEAGAHMWNYVQLDGAWYAVDVTWDDAVVEGGGDADGMDTYFLAGRNTQDELGRRFAVTHKNDAGFDYPALSAEKYKNTAS